MSSTAKRVAKLGWRLSPMADLRWVGIERCTARGSEIPLRLVFDLSVVAQLNDSFEPRESKPPETPLNQTKPRRGSLRLSV